MGLVVFGAFALYLLVSIAAVAAAARAARKRGRSGWRWGGLAALAMYLLVFWDHLPTLLAHRYYCEKEAGFWVYKSVEQWKRENPDVLAGLWNLVLPIERTPGGDIQILDERFAIKTTHNRPLPLLTTSISEYQLFDRVTGEVLARGKDVGSGAGYIATGGGFKFWLNQTPCRSDGIWRMTHEMQTLRGMK